MQKKLFVIDTNVLMDLAAKDEEVMDALATIRKKVKYVDFVVVPTVLQELVHITRKSPLPPRRKLALKALQEMHHWGFSLTTQTAG